MESKWFYYISPTKYRFPFFQQNYCSTLKCDKLWEYTDSAHTEVEDSSDEYDRCGHDKTIALKIMYLYILNRKDVLLDL